MKYGRQKWNAEKKVQKEKVEKEHERAQYIISRHHIWTSLKILLARVNARSVTGIHGPLEMPTEILLTVDTSACELGFEAVDAT